MQESRRGMAEDEISTELPSQEPPSQDQPSQELDQALVARVQRGDSAAFDLLVRKYQHRIAALISRYIHDWSEVQDVAQDTFLRAYRAIAVEFAATLVSWCVAARQGGARRGSCRSTAALLRSTNDGSG